MTTVLLGFAAGELSEVQLSQIREVMPDARLVITNELAEIEPELEHIEIAAGFFPASLIARALKLRWYQQWYAGADWLLRHPEVARLDFVLTNVSGIHAIPISEHVFAMLLALGRRLNVGCCAQERREWHRPEREELFELANKTMLIIGVGAVGERIARIAHAMDMRVLGIRRHPEQTIPEVERMEGPEALHALLPEADVIVLVLPMTPETKGMLGSEELALCKPTAYVVNVGRGGTIDEESLLCALQEGRIAGAGLDVFAEEPLPEDSPFWGMEQVIITAHYAGSMPHYNQRAFAVFLDNLRRYRAGQPLRHIVDKQLGY